MSGRSALILLVAAISVSGCLDSEAPAKQDPSPSVAPPADQDWNAGVLAGPEIWRLAGPGVQEYHLRSETAFALTSIGYSYGHANVTGSRSADNGSLADHWMLLRPRLSPETSGTCPTLEGSGIVAWSNLFDSSWGQKHALPAGDYVIVAEATEGWIDLYFNDAATHVVDDTSHHGGGQSVAYETKVFRPSVQESGFETREGLFAETLEIPRAGYLFAEFSIYGTADVGESRGVSELRDADEGRCEQKEFAAAEPPSGSRLLEHSLALNEAGRYQWKGNYSGNFDPFPGQSARAVALFIMPPPSAV